MKPDQTSRMRAFNLFCKRSDGSSTIEFVILFPMIMMLFLATVEFGFMMVRQSMLETGVDKTVRYLRLGQLGKVDQNVLRTHICKYAGLIPDCENTLLIELRTVKRNTGNDISGPTVCMNRNEPDITPVVSLNSGLPNELVLIRACAVFTPIFPTTKLGMKLTQDNLGGYAQVAKSAFVVEPK